MTAGLVGLTGVLVGTSPARPQPPRLVLGETIPLHAILSPAAVVTGLRVELGVIQEERAVVWHVEGRGQLSSIAYGHAGDGFVTQVEPTTLRSGLPYRLVVDLSQEGDPLTVSSILTHFVLTEDGLVHDCSEIIDIRKACRVWWEIRRDEIGARWREEQRNRDRGSPP